LSIQQLVGDVGVDLISLLGQLVGGCADDQVWRRYRFVTALNSVSVPF
jgi:hypothetical protein